MRLGLDHFADAQAQALRRPTEVGFEDLTDVHTRRHAQRVQHDVGRRTVGHERHVFDRDDTRDHTLVTVAARHLVARLQAALDGQVDLDHLLHARLQLVALRQLLALLFEGQVELVALLVDRFLHRLEGVGGLVVGRTDVEPVELVEVGQVILVDDRALGQLLRTAVDGLADQQALQTLEGVAFDDAQLVVQVQAEALQLVVDDLLGALVADDAFTGEHLHVDHGTDHARRHAQRSVLHVGRFFAEDRAQQLLFRGQLGLALRRDLTDQHVAGLHFGADVDDARFIQTRQLVFSQVRDVAGDFFRAQFGVAGNHRQFLDVDRGVAVVLDDVFRDQDRVLEVQAVPRHERHQHVLAQCQFAQVGRGAVGDDVAAWPRDRPLSRSDAG